MLFWKQFIDRRLANWPTSAS